MWMTRHSARWKARALKSQRGRCREGLALSSLRLLLLFLLRWMLRCRILAGRFWQQSRGGHMKSILKAILAAALLSVLPLALAQDVATDTKKAAKDTGHATDKAAKATGHATKVAAKDTAKGTEKAADKTGHATKVAAKDTAKGTEKAADKTGHARSEEHQSELQSLRHLVCRLL